MYKGAILGGASSARAPPLFLPRPESIYISRFFGVKIPRNSPPRPVVHHHFLAPIGAPGYPKMNKLLKNVQKTWNH